MYAAAAQPAVRAPGEAFVGVLHGHPQRRGSVQAGQRRRRGADDDHVDRLVGPQQRGHAGLVGGGDAAALAAANGYIAGRNAGVRAVQPSSRTRAAEARRDAQASLASMGSITQETLSVSGILLAKVFGRQAHEVDRYRVENANQAELQVRQAMVGRSFFAVTQAFFGISPALVYLVAGLQGTHGDLSAGTLVAFTTLQSRLLIPINQLLQVSVDVQSSLALFARIFELIDLRPRITDREDALSLAPSEIRGAVALEQVSFRYGGGEDGGPAAPEEALRDVSMRVAPGQLAALVGPSGAGKTTISYLVPRLYDVERGAVKIDGHDVRDLTSATIAGAVGVVTQESYLFGGTVRENISYGRPGATDEEVVAAAKAAFIHERIIALEDGYDTVVGERGYRFSGGERQRLAIARVILEDPPILILDEATSALDTESERVVQQALEALMQLRATIAIAHRLSTIRNADVIFAIERGTIVERGTHDELLAEGGFTRGSTKSSSATEPSRPIAATG